MAGERKGGKRRAEESWERDEEIEERIEEGGKHGRGGDMRWEQRHEGREGRRKSPGWEEGREGKAAPA